MRDTASPRSTTGMGWPELSASPTEPCDGLNPMTQRPCVLGHHSGYHRDQTGAQWLDE
jgi:hypothetical protein